MSELSELFENNEKWASEKAEAQPDFFEKSAQGQAPKYLWLGCADSRVPANEVTGLGPGELFVHRNVANVVSPTDLNMMSVVQYAVDVLKVEHVIVCGHYGCGGVAASVDGQRHGIVDHWIKAIGDLAESNEDELKSLEGGAMLDRLCELNAMKQARNLSQTPVLQDAWARGQEVEVHSWIYQLNNGRLKGLGESIGG